MKIEENLEHLLQTGQGNHDELKKRLYQSNFELIAIQNLNAVRQFLSQGNLNCFNNGNFFTYGDKSNRCTITKDKSRFISSIRSCNHYLIEQSDGDALTTHLSLISIFFSNLELW